MTGAEAPAHWIGLAYEEDGRLLGLGGAYEAIDGRWWATLATIARRPVALLKAARDILETAAAADVPLYAAPHPSIPGSESFLRRLGFEPTAEQMPIMGEMRSVWMWRLPVRRKLSEERPWTP